jgi:cytochrome P450
VTNSEQLVDYPIPPVDAIEPPPEWERMRQQCPVAHVRLPSGDQAALLTRYDDVKQVLELAVVAADLRPVEGLAVGGLREVPVKW